MFVEVVLFQKQKYPLGDILPTILYQLNRKKSFPAFLIINTTTKVMSIKETRDNAFWSKIDRTNENEYCRNS